MICHLHYTTQPCESCAVSALLARAGLLPVSTPRYHSVVSFGEHTLDNMFHPWEKPYPITSREQLRVECEQRGLYSHYLRDSMTFHSGPRRWF
jgi:hypothetical protein